MTKRRIDYIISMALGDFFHFFWYHRMMKINKRQIIETTTAVIVGFALLGSGFWFGFAVGEKNPKTVAITDVANITPAIRRTASMISDRPSYPTRMAR